MWEAVLISLNFVVHLQELWTNFCYWVWIIQLDTTGCCWFVCMLSSHWQSLRFLSLSHIFCPSSLFSTVLWKMGFEKWKWNSVCNQLNTKSVGHSTLHYFHVQNPVIVFRAVRQHGISFSAFISGVCSTIRFAVLRVLDNCAASEVVPGWGITGEQFSQRSEVVWKERKKESVRQLKTTCRSLKFLEAKGALGRMLCCFVITRIFDLRKNCNS